MYHSTSSRSKIKGKNDFKKLWKYLFNKLMHINERVKSMQKTKTHFNVYLNKGILTKNKINK